MRPSRRRERRGSTPVEAAVVMSVALTLILGVVEFGRFQMTRDIVGDAAQFGARTAAVSTNDLTTDEVVALVQARVAGLGLTDVQVQVYLSDDSGKPIGAWNTARFGQAIAVNVSGTYAAMSPTLGIVPATSTMWSCALVRCEID